MASEPPRPSVVTSPWPEMPWNPATSTIAPCSSAPVIRCGDIRRSRALPWALSVRMPACAPVRETARSPRSWTAIAASAQDIISPARQQRVQFPRLRLGGQAVGLPGQLIGGPAHRGQAPRPPACPARRAATSRPATARSRPASPTDVPPNFHTTRLPPGRAGPWSPGRPTARVQASQGGVVGPLRLLS